MARNTAAVAALATALCLTALGAEAMPPFTEFDAPVNLGPVVNSAADEALSALSKDGLSLYLSSVRPDGCGGFDIYVSKRDGVNSPWGPPTNLGCVLNSNGQDAGPGLSRDGHWLFLQSTREGGLGGFDLMVSYRRDTHDDFAWEAPVHLTALNSAWNDAAAVLFEGDDAASAELYFNSNRTGDMEFYVSRVGADGLLGAPELVPELNSPANEQRLAITHDGREVFFSVAGPGAVPGTWRSDIWTSTRASVLDPWTPPVRLDVLSLNGSEQQPAISSDGTTILFNSYAPGGQGFADLYMATRRKAQGR